MFQVEERVTHIHCSNRNICMRLFFCVRAIKINVTTFFCVIDGDWKKARKLKQSPLHILEPVDLKVVFSRAMVVKDSRMAKYVFFTLRIDSFIFHVEGVTDAVQT